MAVFPQKYFTKTDTAVRTGPFGLKAEYKAKSINQAFCGQPKGPYLGFLPSALGSILTLAVGPEGFSIAKFDSQADKAGLDVKVNSSVALDFLTTPPGDFLPDGIQVILRGNFTDDQATTAEIITRPKTATQTVFTVGVTPAPLDLSTITGLGAIVAGLFSMSVDVDGFGPDTISDDGSGALTSVGPALSAPGTINYETGALTGVTDDLTALSNVTVTYTKGVAKDEVLLCRVTGTPGAIVVNATPPADRDDPIAYPSVPFGYMPDGSMEALAAAVDILNEVAAARVDLQNVSHATLKERLDTDLGADAMAFRLGRVMRGLVSNDYQASGGVSEINVSGSLSAVNRNVAPFVTLNGTGSETALGAIADPTDVVRNVCVVIDTTTGDRLIDTPSDRTTVFGRLRQEDDFILDGEIFFVNALTSVTGDSQTRFTLQLEVGDTIQGPDGKFYAVASITNDATLTLEDAYQGATSSSAGLVRRRFRLSFRKISAGVESAHTMGSTTAIRFFFPVFITHAQSNFDGELFMHGPGERPFIPDASTTVPGKVALADAGSPFVGSINLQLAGAPIGGGPFHTLNFTGSPGSLVELSPGVIDVTNLGPIGPTGPGGGPGPPGPPGPPGLSIVNSTPFDKSAEQSLGPSGPVMVSHTVNFGYDIVTLSGGFTAHRDAGTFVVPNDQVEITDIRPDSAQIGTIEGTSGGFSPIDAFVKLYLNAAGT